MGPCLRVLLCSLLALAAAPVAAIELVRVEVRGLADEVERSNVARALSLNRLDAKRRKTLREGRLAYMLRRTPAEARRALEPFGYYDPKIEVSEQRSGDKVTVIVAVARGEAVRVHRRALDVAGAAADDEYVERTLTRFRPREGEVLDHRPYEASKTAVNRKLAERGYFDAENTTHQVSVTRASRSAEIDLAWTSGARYRMGEARFGPHAFRPGLLEQLVDWEPGEPYHQGKLLRLSESLAQLEYFGAVDVTPNAEEADAERRVPIDVELTMAKRTAYTVGASYGTDSGAGFRVGMERRYVNARGHKFKAEANIAQFRRSIGASYRVPAFAWRDGWYTLSSSLQEEDELGSGDTQAIPFRAFEIVGSRSGRIGDWTLTAGLHLQREQFKIFDDTHYASLFYPSLLAQYSKADDPLYPRSGLRFDAEIKAGLSALGSEIDFTQLRAGAGWVHGLGERNRLLLRGEAGTTATSSFDDMPPSMRFYAGGDRSVRGYGYKELGPRITDPESGDTLVIGGKHLLVLSVEVEHMFTEEWGAAVFVDAGNAFNDTSDFERRVGVGVGARWRSPVGPVRVDIGHGLNEPEASFQLHINIGTDL